MQDSWQAGVETSDRVRLASCKEYRGGDEAMHVEITASWEASPDLKLSMFIIHDPEKHPR